MRKLKNEELKRLSIEEFKLTAKLPLVIVLDDVRSLNNVGSAFRTADAFRLAKVFLCGITGKPPHREITKTALGATESVDWSYSPDVFQLIHQLKEEGYTIAVIEQVDQSRSLENFEPLADHKYALIFGNEVYGVNDQVVAEADHCLEIPQFGTKHSLNISVSIGVTVWDFFSKLTKAGVKAF